ncbi:MAG TPA: hypothetical protein VHT27_04395 [Solirubrobacteraceae bacterium]|jgi:hypothetical protein|nr:hypothetical protein [Solirubrobacteraceae bacterium]
MSTAPGGLGGPFGGHPAVARTRRRHMMLALAMLLIPLVAAMAISLQDAKPSVLLAVALIVGVVVIVALLANPRLNVSVSLVIIYLGLLEGPVKLGSGGHEAASVVRDVLIYGVAAGALLRLLAARQKIRLPPLAGWVLAFGTLVLVEALNPNTQGLTKALGGFRQQLEWLPFFFFGYALVRSKRRFRQYFLIVGVLALANGAVGTYQSKLSPTQLAGWGPGYKELINGTEEAGTKGGLAARVYASNGEGHVRPPALGTDAGFGAGVGVIALPATLALLAGAALRRRWPIALLTLGALVGVATGLGRLQVVGAVLAVLIFTLLSFSMGRKVTRPLAVIAGVIMLALPAGALFVSAVGGNTFSRYESIAPGNVSTETKDTKVQSLEQIPNVIQSDPFGVGLGSAGAAAGFGGLNQLQGIGAHVVSAETQYNFILDELGLPGLILWVALDIRLMSIGLRGLRRVRDLEVRLYLAALLATFIGLVIMGFSGPSTGSAAFGPFYWSTAGIFAYWFIARRPRGAASPTLGRSVAVPA